MSQKNGFEEVKLRTAEPCSIGVSLRNMTARYGAVLSTIQRKLLATLCLVTDRNLLLSF